jgi:voltage-gated sodium channel
LPGPNLKPLNFKLRGFLNNCFLDLARNFIYTTSIIASIICLIAEELGLDKNAIKRLFIKDRVVMLVILINSLVLFLGAFPDLKDDYNKPLYIIDYICTVYFVVEVILKVQCFGWQSYWGRGWNKFDFIIVLISAPLLLSPILDTHEFGVILILRVGRLFRFFKLARFIPNQDRLWVGIKRALSASIGFIITLCIYNFILSIGAAYLFADIDPEHFGDPLISIYSMFKVFTVEGWYEIPDVIAANSTPLMGALARFYFIFTVLTGGIIGLSIANAVFVDEMVMDNTNILEDKVDQLKEDLVDELNLMKAHHKEEMQALYSRIHDLIEKQTE